MSTNVASFWDRSRKRLGADVIRVGITGQTTYLKSSTEGQLQVATSESGTGLGSLIASDYIVQLQTGSTERIALTDVASRLENAEDSLSTVTEQVNKQQENLEQISYNNGHGYDITAVNGQFTDQVNANTVKAGEYLVGSGRQFIPKNSNGELLNAQFASLTLNTDNDGGGESVNVLTKIQEFQTFQDNHKQKLEQMEEAMEFGSTGGAVEVTSLTAGQELMTAQLSLLTTGGGQNVAYSIKATNEGVLQFVKHNGPQGNVAESILQAGDIELIDSSTGEKYKVSETLHKMGGLDANSSTFKYSKDDIALIDMTDQEVNAKTVRVYIEEVGSWIDIANAVSPTTDWIRRLISKIKWDENLRNDMKDLVSAILDELEQEDEEES